MKNAWRFFERVVTVFVLALLAGLLAGYLLGYRWEVVKIPPVTPTPVILEVDI